MYINHKVNFSSNSLSLYKTHNTIGDFFLAESVEDVRRAWDFAQSNSRKIYVLGNGSNTIFSKRDIKSIVVKNKFSSEWIHLNDNRFYIGSGELVGKWLRASLNAGLDAPYYLASVPAQIGGALAMNAGRGEANGKTIYDFVEAVDFVDLDAGEHIIAKPSEVVLGHRKTIFTGFPSKYYIKGVFLKQDMMANRESNPIKEHLAWARSVQDHSGPNCGTVFCRSRGSMFRFLRGMRVGDASFSKKTSNWIINNDPDPESLMKLIRRTKLFSYLLLKRPKVENIIVS